MFEGVRNFQKYLTYFYEFNFCLESKMHLHDTLDIYRSATTQLTELIKLNETYTTTYLTTIEPLINEILHTNQVL